MSKTAGPPDRTAADARAPLTPRLTVEEARRELARWTDDGQSVLDRVTRALDEHEALCVALQAARDDGAQLQAALGAARDGADRLRSALEASRDEGARLREQVIALEADNATFRARLGALQAEHADLARVVARGLQGMLSQVLPQVPDGGEARPVAIPAPAPVVSSSPPAPASPAVSPMPPGPVAALAPGEAADHATAPDAVDPAIGPGGQGRPRVLLVDDEPHFTELIAEFLGQRGFEIQIASTGEQAIEVLPEFEPRIVLLDLMMPGIGGMEALRRIKAMRPETSVIMATAIDDRDTARRALALGASDYVTKPLTLDFLESVLAVHVQGILPVPAPGGSVPAPRAAGVTDAPLPSFFVRR